MMEKLRILVNKHLEFLSLTHEAVLQPGEPDRGRTCNCHEAASAQQCRGRSSTHVAAPGAGRSHGRVLLTHSPAVRATLPFTTRLPVLLAVPKWLVATQV